MPESSPYDLSHIWEAYVASVMPRADSNADARDHESDRDYLPDFPSPYECDILTIKVI